MIYDNMTFENILKRSLDRTSNTLDKRQGSIIYDSIAPTAAELALAYIQMKSIDEKRDAEKLSDDELELFISQRTGIERKKATKAIRKGVFSKADGSFFNVPIGSRFTGENLYYKVIGNISNGKFYLECEKSGEIGNDYVGTLVPVDFINGLAKAELTEILDPGYNAETDLSLLTRYYERIRTPATSGNIYHYRNWAKEVEGVGGVKVLSLWAGDNTVKVVIVDSNMLPAEQGLVDRVQEYIDPGIRGLGEGQAPIGAFCTVASAITKEINVSFTVIRDNDISFSDMLTDIKENLNKYLRGITFQSNLVSYAKIGAFILSSNGVLDYQNLLINDGTVNIVLESEDAPVLGQVIVDE